MPPALRHLTPAVPEDDVGAVRAGRGAADRGTGTGTDDRAHGSADHRAADGSGGGAGRGALVGREGKRRKGEEGRGRGQGQDRAAHGHAPDVSAERGTRRGKAGSGRAAKVGGHAWSAISLARARSFSVSLLSWPQAARLSRPRGVRTGAA